MDKATLEIEYETVRAENISLRKEVESLRKENADLKTYIATELVIRPLDNAGLWTVPELPSVKVEISAKCEAQEEEK